MEVREEKPLNHPLCNYERGGGVQRGALSLPMLMLNTLGCGACKVYGRVEEVKGHVCAVSLVKLPGHVDLDLFAVKAAILMMVS